MALEPGGYADKLGNRYEGRWTVRQLLGVLNETIRSVEVEAVGDDQDGVDLCVEFSTGIRRAQQCKIRNGSSDKWTIADLSRRGILSAMRSFLDKSQSNEFAFVTAVPSTTLHDLCESARASANDPEMFFLHQVQQIGIDRRQAFSNFCSRLNLDGNIQSDRVLAFNYLRRLFIEYWPDTSSIRADLLQNAVMLVNGDPNTVVSVLADFAQDNLRKTLSATSIWAYLGSMKLHPRRLENDARIVPAVMEMQHRFKDSISPDLIANQLIHRDETDRLLSALKDHAVVVLHGVPGQGKSSILYELVTKLEENGCPYLPIRLDRQEPRHTSQQFGRDLGLPESPAYCLNALTKDRFGVLILDQLDAIRWTSRHSLNALDVCKSLVREVRGFRELGGRLSVVLACRTYDLQNDPQIKNWLGAEKELKDSPVEIGVESLSSEFVKSVAQQVSQNVIRLSSRQIEILQLPQHLSIWVRIVQERGAFEFQNRIQLMHEFWVDRLQELNRRGIAVAEARSALAALVDYMEVNGSIAAPRSTVADPLVLSGLFACGLIKQDGGQVTFGHQSYLDFQIASRVVREIFNDDRNVCEWLGDKRDQSLFRREQLRQALCLLNEESPDHFCVNIKRILADERIRFHLKHLCLEVLSQLENPSRAVLEFLDGLVQRDEWKEHIMGTVYFRHTPYLNWLIERGRIREWLESDSWRNYGLWLLRGASVSLHSDVAKILRLYLGRDDEWNNRILATIPWTGEEDCDEVFELRVELARLGIFRDHVDWSKLTSERSLNLLVAVVSSWKSEDLSEGYGSHAHRRHMFDPLSAEHRTALSAAFQADVTKAWESFIPHICRLAPVKDEPYGALELWIEGDPVRGTEYAPHILVELIVECGKSLARSDSSEYWQQTESLRDHESPVLQYILVETYAALAADHASAAIDWILADLNRLSVGTGRNEPEWAPAARVISQLSCHCSVRTFQRLEQALIHFHSPDELRSAKYWLSSWRKGFFGDYWGRTQHFLLPVLCKERRSKEAIGLIGVLDRKYELYPQERFLRGSKSRGGFVCSTLAATIERISDKAWLNIVENKRLSLDRDSFKHWHDGHLAESSVRYFSQDLARIAKRFPRRFGQLALRLQRDVAPEYRAAIIEGMTNTNAKEVPEHERAMWQPASVDLIESVLATFPGDTSRTYAINFCWLMFHRAEERWSDVALAQLVDYACNHPDPEPNALVLGNENGTFDASQASVSNLESNSLNGVRGVSGMAIGEQLRNHPDLLGRFRSTIEHLCSDPHPAVRIVGLETGLFILNAERDFAIKCFCEATSDDLRVAASRWAAYYFNVGIESHFQSLSPIILSMLHSENPDVAQEGAKEITARWLFHDYFTDEVKDCLTGTVAQRMGMARIASGFVHKPEYFHKCAILIECLKNDSSAEVRRALQEIVRSVDVLSTPGGLDLVKEFVQSQAFLDDPTPLVFTLREYTGRISPFSDVLFAICRQFFGPLCEATRDPAKGMMHDVSEVVPMLIRLYEEANEEGNSETVTECLNMFDEVFQRRLGVATEIAQIVG